MQEKYQLDDKNQTGLLNTIKYILTQKEKIKIVSDLAFDAVDLDENGSLDKFELSQIMKEVAHDMRVKAPTENDIEDILDELDEDNDHNVDKEEFVKLIVMVFEKMLDNEKDLIQSINSKNVPHDHDEDGHGHGH